MENKEIQIADYLLKHGEELAQDIQKSAWDQTPPNALLPAFRRQRLSELQFRVAEGLGLPVEQVEDVLDHNFIYKVLGKEIV